MKNKEIKELSTKELIEKIHEEQDLLLKLKVDHSVSPLDSPTKIKVVRRYIARLKTELHNRTQN